MKIGCIQLKVSFADVEKNFSRVEMLIREAVEKGAEIVVLPEMWNTSYALDRLEGIADVDGVRTKAFLANLARELHVHIVGGSVSTKKGDAFYNTMLTYNNSGELVGEYDKAHLFRLMDEHLYLAAGSTQNNFQLGDLDAAGVICYDIRFPEWLRLHALNGAQVIFVSAQWPTARIDHWKILLQARAIENQCFIVAINRISNKPENFNGQSMVIEPWGEILWTGAEDEELAIVDIDIAKVDEVRKKIPVYDDRRSELYGDLVKK
ncbi:carbon-nitrogen family hydrolase [Kurthia sibirica]|uniref:Carbon-nitrogen hydrolase n=1 Tax=Kurthia sibirica TaxID=202750 RepID=A0A2U3APP0_9BACL|nr:carbon-nitrogen family hydrolase [Kurthia sibirica]PWI26520.1 carbon-nitrogen hydrolase [Kurthia sibirica]GEK32764.1 hydrolase [Kurthia sibirica]